MPYQHYSFAFNSNGPSGSSRLVWFILGGVATMLWMKARERRNLIKDARAALPPQGPFSTPDSAKLRERLARMNVETSEAAIDVADATLDAALRIVGALKETLAEQRAESEQARRHTRPQASQSQERAEPSMRPASPAFSASFHHVEGAP
ncbi:hypothetical protein BDV93DRAFT_607408 [Ceratobasidium sp. AG-I]|nr:hypothetical protein BDV93DRAFT_607408 [Ceratobasidium sp. AG-I]